MKNLRLIIILTVIISIYSCGAKTANNKKVESSVQNIRTIGRLFIDSFPPPTGYVNDYEGVFLIEERQTLDSLIRNFEKRTTIQMAVVTLNDKITTAEGFDTLTLRIANYWGVGQKEKNNGVLLGVSLSLRKIRIHNGYGIEKILSDEETAGIINTSFIPYYQKGKYFEGTLNGIKELMAILEKRNKDLMQEF